MKFRKLEKRHRQLEIERKNVLEFIQNHAAKNDFLGWLNANYQQQFSEDADWQVILAKVKSNDGIRTASLHQYANTLTDQEDVTKMLKDIEKETTKAEAAVTALYDASIKKRLSMVIGGASMLGGLLFIVASALIFSVTAQPEWPSQLQLVVGLLSATYGVVNVLAGLLLVSS